MGRKLVIVESPTKAKTINKILGTKEFVVRASYGHVRDLPKSKMGIDIENDFEPTYTPLTEKGKSAVIAELKTLAKDAPEIYLCSDPDRDRRHRRGDRSAPVALPREGEVPLG